MNILKAAALATLVISGTATAGIPVPDFSMWAKKTLQENGIEGARVIETQYPFNFTYCDKDSFTLWRYDEMSMEHLEAIRDGKTVKPLSKAERTVALETDSASCKSN
uniref:hypothetical protein n=1 Tax=Aquipseudomonas alcaligenes TaxID=43263 RepID=UPI00155DDA4E|nr:hypothetical protein [Pseudomonas alcaligenes]